MDSIELIENLTEIKANNGNSGVSLYDFVASNYYNMTKEQLKELILNLDYILYDYFRANKQMFVKMENMAIEETINRLAE